MKNSALEVLKASAISNIEKRVDLLLAAKKIAYEGEVAPVRKPQHRQMRTWNKSMRSLHCLSAPWALRRRNNRSFPRRLNPCPKPPKAKPAGPEAPEAEQDESSRQIKTKNPLKLNKT